MAASLEQARVATDFAALLSRAPERIYKDDGRSRVGRRVDDAGRKWVVKRFTHAVWRQRLTARLGQHPAQREALWHGRLIEAEMPVVAVVGGGVVEDGPGAGEHWLVTPYLGTSLYNWLRHCDPVADAGRRHDFTRQLGLLTGRLLAMRVTHGDHKASNVVLDEARLNANGHPVLTLIDAGACRGFKGTPLLGAALPMLLNVLGNVRDAASYHDQPGAVAVTRTDRLRFLEAMLEAWPSLPDGMQHLVRNAEFA